jgi:DNA polymerase-3 subunit epsilon
METEPAAVAIAAHEAMQVTLDLIVVRATPDELAAHDRHLAEIDKASAGACLWKRLEAGKA